MPYKRGLGRKHKSGTGNNKSRQEDVLPFLDIIGGLAGCWNMIFTNGWDTWPCQQAHFYLPGATKPEPLPLVTAWPLAPNTFGKWI
jgi:hypothetical protein